MPKRGRKRTRVNHLTTLVGPGGGPARELGKERGRGKDSRKPNGQDSRKMDLTD